MTAITINIPNSDVSFFKKMMPKMGWTYTMADEERQVVKPRLYDPETGECLNDKTMKVIQDARKGQGIAFTGSFEDFKKWAEEV